MIIDITQTNLINVQEGDMIYSVGKDKISTVTEVKSVRDIFKGECVHIFTDTELSYLDNRFKQIDVGTYKIFREITLN